MDINSLLSAGVVSVLCGIAIFALIAIVGVFAIVKQKRILKKDTNGDKSREFYEEYIGDDITKTLKSVGIDPSEYNQFCSIANVKPNYYLLVIFRIIGLILLVVSMALMISQNTYLGFAVMVGSVFIMNAPKKKVQSIAKDRKERFNAEIPRFLDMLESALVTEMPIQNAMEFTTKYLDGVLADEMKFALAETEMGAKTWNEALFDVANKYENDNFSDFALDISTAYSKGVPVIESVRRKSKQIKESNLLLAKENATKLTNQMLIPTVIFKMIPIMAAFLLPVLESVMVSF